MRIILIFLFIGSSFWACEQKDTTPEGILPREEMVSFLIDLHIAEARINELNLRRDSAEKFFRIVEDSLFRKNGIESDSVYFKSYEYYLSDVQGLDDIYSAVVDSLSLRERLSKEKEKEEEKESAGEKESVEKDTVNQVD